METIKPNLRAALAAAQDEIKGLVFKDGRNTDQGYRFVGHEDVIAHVRGTMIRHGIVIVPLALEFVRELRWPTAQKERVAWLWDQKFLVKHASSDECLEASVQVTTMPNDKAAFVASTAADRTLLMRLMRLAGTSDENPEHDSHDQNRDDARQTHTRTNVQQRPQNQRAQAQRSGEAARVVQTLLAELAKSTADRETLARFYEHARSELALCHADEQQKLQVQQAFGQRCEAGGIKPREVVTGRTA